jgi:hypothetical protein
MGTEERETRQAGQPSAAVDLYWIPLGAGPHIVRLSGRLFEAIIARVQRRRPCDLYHSALVIVAPEGRFVIEQTRSLTPKGNNAEWSWRGRSDQDSVDDSVSFGTRSGDGETPRHR